MSQTEMSAAEVKQRLGLVPHPCEGGCYLRTYQGEDWLDPAQFPGQRYDGPRRTGTAIYYLLEPDTFSEMHRLASDEVFHFYLGDAVEQLQLWPGGGGTVVTLGPALHTGERPQGIVPRGVWQGASLRAGGAWALLGCTVSPGFEFADYQGGEAEALVHEWPQWEPQIRRLCRR